MPFQAPSNAFFAGLDQGTNRQNALIQGQNAQQTNQLNALKLAAAQGDPAALAAQDRLDPSRITQQLGISQKQLEIGGQIAKGILSLPEEQRATAYSQYLPQIKQLDPQAPDDFNAALPHLQTTANVYDSIKPRDLKYVSNNGQVVAIDPRTGQASAIFGEAKPYGGQAAPSGYTYNQQGALSYIPGGPADPANKPQTEAQSNAALFATRMNEAEPILQKFSGANTTKNKLVSEFLPDAIANRVVGEDFQQFDQAKRDYINATLRRESGAAISAGEFSNAEKQYFPQPGDSAAVIAQKQRNRETAARLIGQAAGRTFQAPSESARPAQTGKVTPKAGSTVNWNDL